MVKQIELHFNCCNIRPLKLLSEFRFYFARLICAIRPPQLLAKFRGRRDMVLHVINVRSAPACMFRGRFDFPIQFVFSPRSNNNKATNSNRSEISFYTHFNANSIAASARRNRISASACSHVRVVCWIHA